MLGHGELQPILPGPGASDYERYLRTDELLALQKTPEEMVHRDELLFQTVHQSSELWLKLAVLRDRGGDRAASATDELVAGRAPARTRQPLRRSSSTDALHMLERLSPWEYHEVRQGARPRQRLRLAGLEAAAAHSRRRSGRRSRRCSSAAASSSRDVYVREREQPDVYDLAEALIELDERIAIWRSVHVKMVQRVIGGGAIGTQGTPVAVLAGHDHEGALPAALGRPQPSHRDRRQLRRSPARGRVDAAPRSRDT